MRLTHFHFESKLRGLRNLGPTSAAWLADVGIPMRGNRTKIGAIEACGRRRQAGNPVTTLMAYSIEGPLMDCDWRALPFEYRSTCGWNF